MPRRVGHALGAEHADVAVRDQQNARRAPRRGRHRVNRVRPADFHDRMAGQKRRQVRRDADRPHARPTAAVRNGERLVQVQMANVGADRRGAGQPNLRIHVRAVHVDLAAELVNDVADFLNRILEHAMRRRIRHHQRRQSIAVLLRLRFQIRDVDVAVGIGGDDDHFEAGHDRARRDWCRAPMTGINTTSRFTSPREW